MATDRDSHANDADGDARLEWRRERSERGPALGILDVRFDWMRHPTSERVLKRLVLESVDWVNVVALTKDGLSIMVDQYRFGIGERTLETPGGMVDAGETPLAAAQRELLEETGYGGGKWRNLAPSAPLRPDAPKIPRPTRIEECC